MDNRRNYYRILRVQPDALSALAFAILGAREHACDRFVGVLEIGPHVLFTPARFGRLALEMRCALFAFALDSLEMAEDGPHRHFRTAPGSP